MRATAWLRGAAVFCALGLMSGSLASLTAEAAESETLTILNFNDFHGRLAKSSPDTMAFLQVIEKERQAAGEPKTLVLSAGDNIGASLFASQVQQDTPTSKILSEIGVDASAVGNHEFDRGFADLTDRVGVDGTKEAKFVQLGANVYKKGTSEPALPEYKIFTKSGKKIAVIGAVTKETASLVSPAGISTIDFGDPVDAVNRVATKLTDGNAANGEADILIAEYHEGGPSGDQQTNRANPIYRHMVQDTSPKVAAIFQGHTHTIYAVDEPIKGTSKTRPVVQSGSYASDVGKVVLEIDSATGAVKSYTATNIKVPKKADPDYMTPRLSNAKVILDEALAKADEIGKQRVGSAKAPITRAYAEGEEDRSSESTIGNLVADAMLDRLKDPLRGGAQIAIQNPGGNRADFDAGDITLAKAASILPFANTLMTLDLTGAQFKQVLEEQWQPAGASRAYLQLGISSNVNYTYDSTRPKGDRITGIRINGKSYDPKSTYRVGMASFLAAGGDNFTTIAKGARQKDSGLADLESFVEYVKQASPLNPDFKKRAVEVTATKTQVKAGESVTIDIAKLDFTSKVPVTNKTVTARVNPELGSFPVTAGAGKLVITVPADFAASGEIVLTASPSGTTVHTGVYVTGAPKPPTPKPGAHPSLPPKTGN